MAPTKPKQPSQTVREIRKAADSVKEHTSDHHHATRQHGSKAHTETRAKFQTILHAVSEHVTNEVAESERRLASSASANHLDTRGIVDSYLVKVRKAIAGFNDERRIADEAFDARLKKVEASAWTPVWVTAAIVGAFLLGAWVF